MATRERPLSPHLQVYRPMYTMATSITHRITGLALATGPEAYGAFASVAGSSLGLLVLAGFAFAYWYHFCAGIRHLIWDTGRMMEKPDARRSAAIVVAAALVLTLLTLYGMYALVQRAGGAA